LEAHWSDEFLGGSRHDDLHVGAALDQAADQVRTLVGSDSAGNSK
jgi:hypothetical protein